MGLTYKLNTQALEVSLRQTADKAVRGASAKMREEALEIRDLARSYAPVDDGDLEDAIQMITIKDPNTRRNVFVVYVDPDHPGSGPNQTVGDYGLLVERQMRPYGSGPYNISPKSAAKGPKVGGRFMRRAFDERKRFVQRQVGLAVQRVLAGGRGLMADNNVGRLKSPGDYAGGEE